jgi:hypothetical protein
MHECVHMPAWTRVFIRPYMHTSIHTLTYTHFQIHIQEPSWRGQRRKSLVAQRLAEAEDEETKRKGTGNQELWEAARVGNFDRVMDLLFR